VTLRRKLDFRYALVAGVSLLLLLAGLAHHEFVMEPRVRRELGHLESLLRDDTTLPPSDGKGPEASRTRSSDSPTSWIR